MIDIGSTDFLIKVPSLAEKDFELYSSDLFDQWETCVQKSLSLPDYSISLEIEEGSISGKAKIAAAASALYIGVANYGGFISGLEIIRNQVTYVNKALFESAVSPFDCIKSDSTVRNNGGALSRLHSLFLMVQKGTITADKAMLQAMAMFGEDGENIPGFTEQLKSELENVKKYPEQLILIEMGNYDCEENTDVPTRNPSKKLMQKPIAASQQYRIEIWRESKKDKKHVKLTKK